MTATSTWKLPTLLYLLLCYFVFVSSGCYDPSPAFPPPVYESSAPEVGKAFANIKASLDETVSTPEFDTSSFSFEVTSSTETLFTLYHTAKQQDPSRPGITSVNGSSVYRIASCTKVFTVLAILEQHAKGTLHLDDAVHKYLPQLEKRQPGTLPWKDITLRALGSQLSGIPGDLLQSDLVNNLPNPEAYGLPPKSRKGLPTCGEYSRFTKTCGEKDLINVLRKQKPTFAPAQQPSYCNVGFEILGLVLEKVTKVSYSDYIHKMLERLDIPDITFNKPADDIAVLPVNQTTYWDNEMGVQRPTGGLYSGSSALSAFLRYVLTHYNGITTGALNWLHPSSYSNGMNSFYGMPWEIFRSDKILKDSSRPVTFVTKSGGLPGYVSIMMVVPEYDLGITILVAGIPKLLAQILQVATDELIPEVEFLAQRQLGEKYSGIYRAAEQSGLNSSLELSHDTESGLYICKFISNGTDVLNVLLPLLGGAGKYDPEEWKMQLVPTLLFADQEKLKGELWRALRAPQKRHHGRSWEEFCVNSVDTGSYAGKVLNELVVWTDEKDKVTAIELPAFEVTLYRQPQRSSSTPHMSGWDVTPMEDEL